MPEKLRMDLGLKVHLFTLVKMSAEKLLLWDILSMRYFEKKAAILERFQGVRLNDGKIKPLDHVNLMSLDVQSVLMAHVIK